MTANPQLTNDELREIARLHLRALPGDILPQLGAWYLTFFYKYLGKSPFEKIIAARDENNQIKGACALSFSQSNLMRRVLKHTFLPLVLAGLKASCTSWAFLKTAFLVLAGSPPKDSSANITYIFVDPDYASRGLGRQLLSEAEKEARQAGHRSLSVKTSSQGDNRALDFYKQNGFLERTSLVFAGRPYKILEKAI